MTSAAVPRAARPHLWGEDSGPETPVGEREDGNMWHQLSNSEAFHIRSSGILFHKNHHWHKVNKDALRVSRRILALLLQMCRNKTFTSTFSNYTYSNCVLNKCVVRRLSDDCVPPGSCKCHTKKCKFRREQINAYRQVPAVIYMNKPWKTPLCLRTSVSVFQHLVTSLVLSNKHFLPALLAH